MTVMNMVTKLAPETAQAYVAHPRARKPLVVKGSGHATTRAVPQSANELPAPVGLAIELRSYPQGIRELASPLSD
jgi:hypothetical protein